MQTVSEHDKCFLRTIFALLAYYDKWTANQKKIDMEEKEDDRKEFNQIIRLCRINQCFGVYTQTPN